MATASLKRPEDDPAYAAGLATREKIGAGVNAVGQTMRAVNGAASLVNQGMQAPGQAVASRLGSFTRGLFAADESNGAPAAAKPAAKPVAAVPAAAPAPVAPVAPAPTLQAASPDPVIGQFNGRDITRSAADSIAARVRVAAPGTPGLGGPGNSLVYTPATGGSTGAAPAPSADGLAPAAPAAAVPAQSALHGDVGGAEGERAAALRQVNDAIGRLEIAPSGLNSRGKRQLYATLIGERNALTGKRVDQATTFATEGAREDSAAGIEGARLTQGASEGAANRAAQASLQRDQLTASGQQARSTLQRDDGSTILLRGDGTTSTLTDAQGKPIRQASAITGKDRLDFIGEQIKALNTDIAQNPYVGAEGTADPRAAQLAQLNAQAQALLTPQAKSGGGFQEGGIYRDAQGRSAKYVNGKFVPVE